MRENERKKKWNEEELEKNHEKELRHIFKRTQMRTRE